MAAGPAGKRRGVADFRGGSGRSEVGADARSLALRGGEGKKALGARASSRVSSAVSLWRPGEVVPERMLRGRLETLSRKDGRAERGGGPAGAGTAGGESASLRETERPRSWEVAEPGPAMRSGSWVGVTAGGRSPDAAAGDSGAARHGGAGEGNGSVGSGDPEAAARLW